ncbi:MAG: 16S rRNA (guanine(966)-N(2))-methyltransferase RsmD [Gemmatimonadaceae bacterium]
MRPTADKVREAWMSIVQGKLRGARVLDLFAGSGALGLEALSRGAARAEFVESGAAGVRAIRDNATTLGVLDTEIVIHRADAMHFVTKLPMLAFDVAFADPPYRMGLAPALAERWLAAPFARVVGVEHAAGEALPAGGDTRRYGDTAITFYRAPD